MVGLGETREELAQTFRDLRAVDCDILTIGQYLRPSEQHLPLIRYYHPDEFAEMKDEALALGFKHVESGPLVRSSYHARDQVPGAELKALRRQATIDADGRVVPAAGWPRGPLSAILGSMPKTLSRKVPLAELHCHLGAAVTPAIMWSIAHAQGIKLPTRNYWDFRDLITVHPGRTKSFDGYLQLFHWTELIQSSPIAVERAVYEVVGGAYRKNNVTTMELRFNPMKRNRGGEQDLDHIIAAAVRGMDRATLEYPVKPGLIFCLDRAFPYELNEIIVEKAILWRDRGVVGVDIAGPESATFRVADYKRLLRRARQFGLGITIHTGEAGPVEEVARVDRAARARPHRPRREGRLRPAGDVDAPRARHRPRDLPDLEPQHRRRVGLGRVPLDLRPAPPQRRPLHDQHRRPGDAQDVHPRRARDARAAWHPVAGAAGADRRDLARRIVRAQRLGRAGAAPRARAPQGRGARRGLGRWISTSRPTTCSSGTPSASSWRRRSRPSSTSTSTRGDSRSRSCGRIGELGWLGIPFPEDEGGAGLDTLAYAIAVEEIGRVWGSLGLIVAAHT